MDNDTVLGFEVVPGNSAKEVASLCNPIITATASRDPLLFENDILQGTHITAMGSDTTDKRELAWIFKLGSIFNEI